MITVTYGTNPWARRCVLVLNGVLKAYWLGDEHLLVVVTVLASVNVSRVVGSTCVHISTWSPEANLVRMALTPTPPTAKSYDGLTL